MKRRKKRIRTPAQIQQRARELRQEMTPAEKLLWNCLRNKQLGGLKFRRQHPLGPFVADFYCATHRLVVEIDGDIHDLQPERDGARTEQFEQYGYCIIRFHNEQVLNNIESVLRAIESACHPSSPRVGRGSGVRANSSLPKLGERLGARANDPPQRKARRPGRPGQLPDRHRLGVPAPRRNHDPAERR